MPVRGVADPSPATAVAPGMAGVSGMSGTYGDLPFHIAFPYMLIEAGRSPAVRYERMLQCYEAAVRYCAAVQVSDYLAAGCPDDVFNRMLLDRLGRPLSVGHW